MAGSGPRFVEWVRSTRSLLEASKQFSDTAVEVFRDYPLTDGGRSRWFDHLRTRLSYQRIDGKPEKFDTEEDMNKVSERLPGYHQGMLQALSQLLNPYDAPYAVLNGGEVSIISEARTSHAEGGTITATRARVHFTEVEAGQKFDVIFSSGARAGSKMRRTDEGPATFRGIDLDFNSSLKLTAERQRNGAWKYSLPEDAHIEVTGPDALLARTLLTLPIVADTHPAGSPVSVPLSTTAFKQLWIGLKLRDLFRQISQEPGLQLSDDAKSQFTAYARSHPDQATQVQALVNAVPAAKLAQATQLVDSVLSGTLPAGWPTPLGTEQRQEFKAAFEIVFHSLFSSRPSSAQALGVKYLTACQAEGSALHRLMTEDVGIFSRYSIKEERAARTHDEINRIINHYCPGAMRQVARAGSSVASTAEADVDGPSSASTAGAGTGGGGGQPPSTPLVFKEAAAAAATAAKAARAAKRTHALMEKE